VKSKRWFVWFQVLDKLFGYVTTVKDLKNQRQVHSTWNKAIVPYLSAASKVVLRVVGEDEVIIFSCIIVVKVIIMLLFSLSCVLSFGFRLLPDIIVEG